jgi:hypothetical protein
MARRLQHTARNAEECLGLVRALSELATVRPAEKVLRARPYRPDVRSVPARVRGIYELVERQITEANEERQNL